MTPDEIRSLADLGMDIQLHTHRHQFPPVEELARRELEDNRAVLEPILGRSCHHLCYPSGVFTPEQWPWLEACEIASATTCDRAQQDRHSSLWPAPVPRCGDRDSDRIRGGIAGLAELLRRARSIVRPRPPAPTKNYGH